MLINSVWYNKDMKKVILILVFVLAPSFSFASTASDFTVNPQSTYDVPPGTTQLLILDLTLPGAGLTSIKINNAGSVVQYDLSQISIYEDGPSPGWDGDETERVRKSSSPFWDTEITGDFSKQRIFVTVDINSNVYTGKTIKPEIEINSAVFSNTALNGPTDKKITGFERIILAGTEVPYVPVSPMAQKGEAISASTIRWYFTDLSNNEFGFKIIDNQSKVLIRSEKADLSYLDETGLKPDTEYSGRQVVAFNDRGQSSISTLTVFPAVQTFSLPVVEEEKKEPVPAETGRPLSSQELRDKIQELQLKIIDLLKQLIQLLQQQITEAQASIFRAFEVFTSWLQALFR